MAQINFDILDGLQEPLLVLNDHHKVVFLNVAASLLTGCSQKRVAKGIDLQKVIAFPPSVDLLVSQSLVTDEISVDLPFLGKSTRIQFRVQTDTSDGDRFYYLSLRDVSVENLLQTKYVSKQRANFDLLERLAQAHLDLSTYVAKLERFAFIIICAIFGFSALAIKYSVESIPPFFGLGSRFLIAGLILSAIFFPKEGIPIKRKEVLGLLLVALLNHFAFGAFTYALKTTPSGLAAILFATAPIWVYCLEMISFKQSLSVRKVIGLFSALVAFWILLQSTGEAMDIKGQIYLILLGALAWAVATFIYSNATAKPFSVLALDLLLGSVLLLSVSYFTGEWDSFAWSEVTEKSKLAYLYLLIFGLLIATPTSIWLMKMSSASRASSFLYINPVIALVVGSFLGNESLSLISALACFAILASVYLIVKSSPESSNDRESSTAGH